MPNLNQLLLQRLTQSDLGWMQVVYLAGMFAILIWRRESVVNPWLFRMSYLLFAAALVLPPIISPFLPGYSLGSSLGGVDSQTFINAAANAIGPGFFAGAIICGLGSLLPPLKNTSRPIAAPPPKHPLD